jgi:hypothetical protein
MPDYVLSKASVQPAVTARDGTGLATEFHPTKTVWAPALYKYCNSFEVKERRGVRDWVLCIVDDGAAVAAGAASDPLVQDIPDARLTRVLTGQALVRAQNWIDRTDLNVVFTDGMTVREALKAIGQALGHSSEFERALS